MRGERGDHPARATPRARWLLAAGGALAVSAAAVRAIAGRRARIGAIVLAASLFCSGCSTVPDPPDVVGEDYPGTCMPPEFTWPTDFLESLPGESAAISGSIVGLRLEYVGSEWVWRVRSVAARDNLLGERVDDPSFGRESLADVRTLEILETHDVTLTEAEQRVTGMGAYDAAHLSGEKWPSPLIIEMARVMDGGASVWRITTCDTETDEHSVVTLN